MLKLRIIPLLTFNGLALVKTKQFLNPRMVGNPVQSARVYNSRGVDELVFIDITATQQKRKPNFAIIEQVINECFMPVCVGGGIESIEDINKLLKVGADKVLIKSKAIYDENFIREAVIYFGSQCISIAIDAKKVDNGYKIYNGGKADLRVDDFIHSMNHCNVGEFVITSVDNDGMMNGYDLELINYVSRLTNKPLIAVGGAGMPSHFSSLFRNTDVEAVGSSSIYHFTQYTPHDIKLELKTNDLSVRF